jgi:3-deoxy-D-manno-octulosonate 8-phosphate phosphatase (KDO 8-P phosphatase)
MLLTLSQRCAKIELLVLDVDGVLTEGSIIYADDNAEIKHFHVRDGSGLSATELAADQACFIGDDIPDLPVMRRCGMAVAVADACPDVLAEAHYVTQAPGGRGAVRETIELILACQGQWQKIVERFRNET